MIQESIYICLVRIVQIDFDLDLGAKKGARKVGNNN